MYKVYFIELNAELKTVNSRWFCLIIGYSCIQNILKIKQFFHYYEFIFIVPKINFETKFIKPGKECSDVSTENALFILNITLYYVIILW